MLQSFHQYLRSPLQFQIIQINSKDITGTNLDPNKSKKPFNYSSISKTRTYSEDSPNQNDEVEEQLSLLNDINIVFNENTGFIKLNEQPKTIQEIAKQVKIRKNLIFSYHKIMEKYKQCMQLCSKEKNNSSSFNGDSQEETKGSDSNKDEIEERMDVKVFNTNNKIKCCEYLLFELFDKFTFESIEFAKLPIAYELLSGNLRIICVWSDDQLYNEINRFYDNFEAKLNRNEHKISCLPISVLEKIKHHITNYHDLDTLEMYILNDSLRFKFNEETININHSDAVEMDTIRNYLSNIHIYEFHCDKFRDESFLPQQINFANIHKCRQNLKFNEESMSKLNKISVFCAKTTGLSSEILSKKSLTEIEEENKRMIDKIIENNTDWFISISKMDGHSIYFSIDMNDQEDNNEFLDEHITTALNFIKTRAQGNDFETRDYYFKDEIDFKNFIQEAHKHLIPISPAILCNDDWVKGRFRIMHTVFNKEESNKLQEFINERKTPVELKQHSEVLIKTVEQLRLLIYLSKNFSTIKFKKGKRIHINIKELSRNYHIGNFKNKNININMFFNNKIYDEYFEKERVEYANFFLQIEHSLSLEYPDEIQGKIEDKNIHMFEQLFKMFFGANNKLNKFLTHINEEGERKLKNVKRYLIHDMFCKRCMPTENTRIFDFVMKTIIKSSIEGFLNKFTDHEVTIGEQDKTDINKGYSEILESISNNHELKTAFDSSKIALPGYDYMIPNVIYSETASKSAKILKKIIEKNIDSNEEYHHLSIFRKYLNNEIFNQNDDYKINENSDTFSLRNCWMIVALGTMKLLDDIESNSVIPSWTNKIDEFMSEATLTNFEYYSEVNNEEDKFKIKELTKEIKNMCEIEGDHIWYKLKNPNLFIDYNGVKYFYDSLNYQTEDNGEEWRKYEIISETKIFKTHSHPHLPYDIIQGKCMGEALYAAAHLFRYEPREIKADRMCIIIAEQLSLVNPNPSNELLSELFVPAIIPKYALLSGKYIHYFENILPTVTSIATPHPFTVEFHFFKKYILSSLNSIKGNNNFILEIIKYLNKLK